MMHKKYLGLFIVCFLFLSSMAYAEEMKIIDTLIKEIPCKDNVCMLSDGDLYQIGKEGASYAMHNTFELSGRLVRQKHRIEYYNISSLRICTEMSLQEGEQINIFDIKISNKDALVAFEQHLSNAFGEKVIKFPCYDVKSNDVINIEYSILGKVKPVKDRLFFKNMSLSEMWYPFDKYVFTLWTGLGDVSYTRTDKIITVPSYVQTDYKNTCPFAIKLETVGTRSTINGTQKQVLYNDTLTGIWSGHQTIREGELITDEGKRITIWPTLISGPSSYIKNASMEKHNLTLNQWNNIFDERTGCYLWAIYERTDIVKYFFIVATVLILLSSCYFLWLYNANNPSNSDRVFKSFKASFIIWSFQEGLSSLTPIVRPTNITLFDITVLIPTIFVIIFYGHKPAKQIIKLAIRYFITLISIIPIVFKKISQHITTLRNFILKQVVKSPTTMNSDISKQKHVKLKTKY